MSTLQQRFQEISAEMPEISKADLARATTAAPPSVGAWFNGKTKKMKLETATKAAALYGVNPLWLATGNGPKRGFNLANLAYTGAAPTSFDNKSLKPLLVWEHPDELPAGEYVLVPRLNIQLSAGHGREHVDVDLIKEKPQAFRADWIRELRLRPAGLASMRAHGDSMEPRIYNGDAVVVDTADQEIQDGRTYALWYDGGERIKRLYRLPGGGLRILSDNRDKYPAIDLNNEQCQHVRVLGRVRHVSSTQGF